MAALRFDLVFSYWIFVWFLLYEAHLISFSPKFPILLGIVDNVIMLAFMLLYGTSGRTIFYFIFINTLIKLIPFYMLRNESIRFKDIGFTIFLFLIFILWLHINKQSLFGNIKLIHDSLLYGKNETPFMALLDKIKYNFKKLQVL